ncbi:MAG: DUF3784 domain-containing protein [Eubacteriales bacterium]|nr:DUF3784 domain-containing protein [Eubacteriales bacterium]
MRDLILAVLTGIISVVLFIYVSFSMRCKGPILSNSYLFASEDERKNIDKKAEYRMVSVVFCHLAIIFALLTIYILTSWKVCIYGVYVLIVCVVVYAIKQAIQTEQR